jgi:hypothetical protein
LCKIKENKLVYKIFSFEPSVGFLFFYTKEIVTLHHTRHGILVQSIEGILKKAGKMESRNRSKENVPKLEPSTSQVCEIGPVPFITSPEIQNSSSQSTSI